MTEKKNPTSRTVTATHGKCVFSPDPSAESTMAKHLKENFSRDEILALYSRYSHGLDSYDSMMRRVLWKALAQKVGSGLKIGIGVSFKHLETFNFGNNVFIGDHAILQGRFDGNAKIEDGSWIGPQAFLDARELLIGKNVGLGPGVKILGSVHTGIPTDLPIIETDLEIRPVIIEEEADIGTGAIILPGIKIGKGAIVGAGAVVNNSVSQYDIVAGIPATFVRKRE